LAYGACAGCASTGGSHLPRMMSACTVARNFRAAVLVVNVVGPE
jgi:hypothetical protein